MLKLASLARSWLSVRLPASAIMTRKATAVRPTNQIARAATGADRHEGETAEDMPTEKKTVASKPKAKKSAGKQPQAGDEELANKQEKAAPAKKRKATAPKPQAEAGAAAKQEGDVAAAGADAKPATKRAKKPEPEPAGPSYSPSMRPGPPDVPVSRLLSWNVAGLRAVLKKDPDAMTKLLEREQPDIICLQEIKISDKHVEELEAALKLQGWHVTWNCCTAKAGYSGTATFCKTKPLSATTTVGVANRDDEGRVVATEHPTFWLVNAYTPNSGQDLKWLDFRVGEWDKALSGFCKELEARGKPVVLTGDLNCAHKEIDIHSPKTNLKSAGFTVEERQSFQACYLDQGFVDTFRAQHPGVVGYTYFSHRFNSRQQNKGWRLDYFLVSSQLAAQCYDSFMLQDVVGSDHVPIGLILKNT